MAAEISWLSLSWCLLPFMVSVLIYSRWHSNPYGVLVAGGRMLVQLILVGYALVILFNQSSPWYSGLVVMIMALIAGVIAIRPVKEQSNIYLPALFAIVIAVTIHLLISLKGVMQVEHWYEPRTLIPLAGMYLANTMNAVSLAAERLYSETQSNKTASNAHRLAFQSSMIPQVNSLLAVGLVALPGMMTGQILSGVSPLIAVRYQIMIMTMILGCSVLGVVLFFWFQQQMQKRLHA